MGRIQGLTEVYLTGDTLLKSEGAVEIFSIVIAGEGATAGQRIVFRNGTTAAAPVLLPVVLDAANTTIPLQFANGKRFENGCFVDFEGSAGKIHCSLTYK